MPKMKLNKKRDEEVLAARTAGIAENKMMQAWLDTLENPEDSNNIDFMAWVSDRRGEFLKKLEWCRRFTGIFNSIL